MKRFIEGVDRTQVSLLPECVEDYVEAENPVRVIEVFVEQLDLRALGFEGIDPEVTGHPAYHPSVLLKIYIYGYLNRVQSSRRLLSGGPICTFASPNAARASDDLSYRQLAPATKATVTSIGLGQFVAIFAKQF